MSLPDSPPHRRRRATSASPAPGVFRLPILFVNVYLVGEPGGPWVLVDTGLPWFAGAVRRRARALFGGPPEAIVLTHGHFDHAGNAEQLALEWGVPVFAHRLEMPFLTGLSKYPPYDPTVGGAMGLAARSFPTGGCDLGRRVEPLPGDGAVPGLPDWRWLHTPGHTAGHVSLLRPLDGTLLAGDAVATSDQGSLLALLTGRVQLTAPPAPSTTDWSAAKASVAVLAELRPFVVAAGHGRPARGPRVAEDLARLAARFSPPRRGRYVERPARTDERGIVELPPPVPDPLPKQLLVAGLAAGALFALVQAVRARADRPLQSTAKPKRKLRKG